MSIKKKQYMKVRIIKINHNNDFNNDLELPKYQTNGSAGLDVCSASEEPIIVPKGKVALIPTGLAMAIPDGYECQVRSRSGLAAKNMVFCLNSPGTIDSDYRGEIKVILANLGDNDFVVNYGDRVAQLVFNKYATIEWEFSDTLDETERGAGGFGSTGK